MHVPKNNDFLISICIANFNGENLLVDCIDSILNQQGDLKFEIIVHDDASTDKSLQILSSYPDVVVIRSAENVGFCVANNRMVNKAQGRWVLLLNNDAALLPDALDTLVNHALSPGTSRILSLPQYDWVTGKIVDRGCLLDAMHVPVPNLNPNRDRVAYVIGACLWISRSDWIKLGGFPEWMQSIGEDLFLCANARLNGMHIEVSKLSGYRHRQGVSFGGNRAAENKLSTNYRRRYLSERNRAAVMVICTPGVLWIPWISLHLLLLMLEGLCISMAKFSTQPWSKIYGATFIWLWLEKKKIFDYRESIQKNKKIGFFLYLKDAYTYSFRKISMLVRHGLPSLK